MHNVFQSVFPIFLIAFLGSIIRRKWLKSDEFWRGLEKLSFYVLFPSMLLEHTLKVNFGNSDFTKLTLALIAANLLVSAGLVIFQRKNDYDRIQFTSVFQGATRYNNYIFFAIGSALFGNEGLTIIATISPYLLIVTNATSVMSFAYYIPKKDRALTKTSSFIFVLKSIGSNPFVFASILGVLLNYFHVSLNKGIENTIHNFSDSALVIGILIVGAGIKITIQPQYLKQIFTTGIIKLAITPILTFIVLSIMGVTETSKSIGILFSCLPCSSTSYILSRQLGGDPETMSSIITFTTIFSILSLSLFVYILG